MMEQGLRRSPATPFGIPRGAQAEGSTIAKAFGIGYSKTGTTSLEQALEKLVARFDDHNAAAIEYLETAGANLLVMDLEAGDGWMKLCEFLGASLPDVPFPNRNGSR